MFFMLVPEKWNIFLCKYQNAIKYMKLWSNEYKFNILTMIEAILLYLEIQNATNWGEQYILRQIAEHIILHIKCIWDVSETFRVLKLAQLAW